MFTEKEITKGMDEAYKTAGDNAYFGNGFYAGIEFAKKEIARLENEKMMLTKACSELNKGDSFAHVNDVPTMIEKAANILEIKATNEGNQSVLVTPLLNISKNIRFSLKMCEL